MRSRLTWVWVAVASALAVAVPAVAAGSGAAPSPSATPSPTPVGIARVAGEAGKYRDLGINLLIAAASLVALLLIPLALFRLAKRVHSDQLLIVDVVNATGNPNLDPRKPGLSELIREELLRQLRVVDEQVEHFRERSDADSRPLLRAPLPLQSPPKATPDQTLDVLTSSVSGLLGDAGGPIVSFLTAVLLRARGHRVTPTPRSGKGTPPPASE